MCKGRLLLGVGAGSNISDVEFRGMINEDNRNRMLEELSLKKLLNLKNWQTLKPKISLYQPLKEAIKN